MPVSRPSGAITTPGCPCCNAFPTDSLLRPGSYFITKDVPHVSLSPPGARLLPTAVPSGAPADHPKPHYHVPGFCGHLHGGVAWQQRTLRRHRRQRPHLPHPDHHLRPHERPHHPGEPVLGASRTWTPSTAAWALPCTPDWRSPRPWRQRSFFSPTRSCCW